MNPLDLVKLSQLMEITIGKPNIQVGLIDGPVSINHPDLAHGYIRDISNDSSGMCTMANSTACTHGTFVAGVLSADRNSSAPAICPGCTLLVRTIFSETAQSNGLMPSATPEDLVLALLDCIKAGAHIINLSVALIEPSVADQCSLKEALNYAASRDVIIVAAAGNLGAIGSTTITRHPWVIPVVACDLKGKPLDYSNLGNSIARRGLRAPGENITSISTNDQSLTFSGTSAAAPFVTGAIALLWSEFPHASSVEVKYAVKQFSVSQGATVVPPLLDAWRAFQLLNSISIRRK